MVLNINFLVKIFFTILLLELFLLGSGQFLSFGGFSLRMFFYMISMSITIILLLTVSKMCKNVLWFLIIYVTMIAFSTFIGVMNNATSSQIFENLKPLLFAFMIIPFSLFIINSERILLLTKLIKFSGLFMGISFILFILLLLLGYIDFYLIYNLLSSDANDFMINSGDIPRIFYKGFLYLNIAFIFYVYSDNKYKFLILFLLFLSILLTFTRGYLLALVLSFILILILEFNKKRNFFILIITLLCVGIFLPFYANIIGEREASDSIRILQIEEVFNAITLTSFFIGHGYGIGVPIRPDGMEITFLEIFHKQGILGLFLWLGFLLYLIYNYLNIKDLAYKKIFKPFLVSTFFVYFQSMTNPYLNNPIGMTVVLLTFSVLIFIMYSESKERLT